MLRAGVPGWAAWSRGAAHVVGPFIRKMIDTFLAGNIAEAAGCFREIHPEHCYPSKWPPSLGRREFRSLRAIFLSPLDDELRDRAAESQSRVDVAAKVDTGPEPRLAGFVS
jgi:hypothetical protein